MMLDVWEDQLKEHRLCEFLIVTSAWQVVKYRYELHKAATIDEKYFVLS